MCQSGSGQIQRQISTSHQPQKRKVALDLQFLISLQNKHDCWPVAFLRSLLISELANVAEIGENQIARDTWALMSLCTCERHPAWEPGRYAIFLQICQTNWQILSERLHLLSFRTLDTKIVSETKWCSCYQKLCGEKIDDWLPITCQRPLGTWQIYFIKSKASVSV